MNNDNTILKKSTSLGVLAICGKILGFIKQAVIAWAFGANALTDVFFAADGYASMFGQIMGQTVSPTVLTQHIKLQSIDEKRSRAIIHNSYLFFGLLSLVVILINCLFADQICTVIGLAYSPDQTKELGVFLVAMLPVMFFTSMAGVSTGYLDSFNRFVPGRLNTVFYSVSIILVVLMFRQQIGLRSLLIGFLLGYILHMVYMLILVLPRVGVSISNPFKNPDFIVMIRRFVPLVIGISIVDLGHLIDKIIASSLEEGSVSSLYYGQVISSDVIIAVIISSVGSVLLPSLTRSVAEKTDCQVIVTQIQKIMCTMTFVMVGITALYFVEGVDLIRLFFQRGSFDASNTKTVAMIAVCYSTGFVFIANRDVLVRAHYAFQDTGSPMVNSLIGMGINVVLSIALAHYMGVKGIALATSITVAIVFILLVVTLKKHVHSIIVSQTCALDMMKSIIACVLTIMAGRMLFLFFHDAFFVIRLLVIGLMMSLFYFIICIIIRQSTALDTVRLIKKELDHKWGV